MYVATRGENVKWGGTDFKWGCGHHWPPAGDDPGSGTFLAKGTMKPIYF